MVPATMSQPAGACVEAGVEAFERDPAEVVASLVRRGRAAMDAFAGAPRNGSTKR